MSRYRPEYRDMPYRDAAPPRWDRDSFARAERDRYGGPPIIEQQRPPYAEPYSPRRAAPVYEEERYYEQDRYGPGGRQERRYWEDDYYRDDPRVPGGAMVPFRPGGPARPEPPAPVAPPRMVRRQSSLDFYDRRAPRRDFYEDRAPPPARAPPRNYYDRQYDDVQVQDPYAYGDDGFREYREREWVRRRRNSSGSRSRSRSRARSEFVESVKEEKPYPRRGKTRMPKRLVHTKVLFDLGYPYYEEDEKTILIEKALGPDNIDEVFTKSKEYFARETTTTRLIEAPPPEHIHAPPASVKEVEIKEKEIDEIKTVPLSEAPRSVREWDALSVRSGAKSARSRSRRRSRRGSSPHETVREEIIEKKEKIIERAPSPARTHRSHRTRDGSPTATSRSGSEVIIEKKIIREEDDFDESNSVHVGPLALVVDRHPDRTDRDIKDEIRRLEAERRSLRRERRYERESGELIKVERVRERSPSPVGEIIVENRRGDEVLEVKKDKRVRSVSRPAAPSPGIIKAMMATLT